MITDQETVFLGAVVQPKTKAPVWVVRKSYTWRTAAILVPNPNNGTLMIGGEGYLDGGDMGSEYLRAAHLTGFPRVHTPDGVRDNLKGQGYGTCLYTGLVMLAAAIHEKKISPGERALIGKGQGICSDKNTRSSSASEWWEAAVDRGLAEQEEGEAEMVTEEIEDEDLFQFLGPAGKRAVIAEIREQMSDSDWHVQSVGSVNVTMTREVEAEDGTLIADYYTLTSAEKHKLVAVTDTRHGTSQAWGKDPKMGGTYYPTVICALNVSGIDPIMVGKLAACALAAGASEVDVTAMVLRNRFGLDLLDNAIGTDDIESMQLGSLGRARLPASTTSGTMLQQNGRRRVPLHEPPSMAMRRNPPGPEPTRSERRDLERSGERLERIRDDLGWNKLEDLP